MLLEYRVRDQRGTIVEGQLDAESEDAAAQQLRQEGYAVLSVSEAEAGGSLFARRVSKQDVIYLTSQLAIMTETGINLSTALGGILAQEQNPSMRKILADLKSSVESG